MGNSAINRFIFILWGNRTRSDSKNPSGFESNQFWLFKKSQIDPTLFESDLTRLDPRSNDLQFNQNLSKIWKTQHVNWPDSIRLLLKNQTELICPIRTRPESNCHFYLNLKDTKSGTWLWSGTRKEEPTPSVRTQHRSDLTFELVLIVPF
jgi:hypothetical protein